MVVKQESSLPNEACREGLLQPWIMEMINTDKNGYSCSLCQLAGLGKAAKPVFILFLFFCSARHIMWGVYSKTCFHHHNIPLAHSSVHKVF